MRGLSRYSPAAARRTRGELLRLDGGHEALRADVHAQHGHAQRQHLARHVQHRAVAAEGDDEVGARRGPAQRPAWASPAGTSTKAGLMTVECPSDSSIVLAASVRARPLSRYGLGARTIFFIPYPAPRETRRLSPRYPARCRAPPRPRGRRGIRYSPPGRVWASSPGR